MTYYVNYLDKKDSYKGFEVQVDSLEELINILLYKRDISSIEELVELEDVEDVKSKDSDLQDWVIRNKI